MTGAGLFGGELSHTFSKFQNHAVLYRVTAADCAHGSIRLSADRAEYGSTVEATAVPDSGYTCVQLTLNGQALGDKTFTVSGDAVVSAVFAPDSSEPMEGAGTAASPYLIRNAGHLASLRTDPSACYRLMNDVDYLGDLWEPVSSFTGTFDGNGYAVSNITIHPAALGNCGFFGEATNAEIKNLTLRNVDIKLTRKDSSMYSYLGCAPLVGYANGSTISGCAVEQAVIEQASPYYYIGTGGLVGYASGSTIRSCMSSADITASQYSNLGAGGLVGYMDGSSSVDTCMAFGSVKAYVCGGFVSRLESGKITNSCSYVSVASPSRSDISGGFAASTLGTVQYCYCTGDVVTRTGNLSGCFAGYAGGTISNCWSNNTVTYTDSDEVSLLFVASKGSLTLTTSANVYGQTDSTYQDSYLSSPWTRDTSGHGYRMFSDSWFTPQSITLESLPERSIYALNEPVDLEETVLVLTFSSGLHMRLDAGAYASFDTSAYGASEVTVSCMNKTVSFPIRVCRNGVEILDVHDDYLTLAVNCEDDAVLVAAVYQSGKLVTTRTLDLSFSADKLHCFLSSPDDCTVKVFLLDRHSVPKAPAAVPKG